MAVAALLAGGAVALTGSVASATTLPPTITSVGLAVSNNAAGQVVGGVTNTATYTWSFTTATASITPTALTFTVPTGTTKTSTLSATIYGITGCSAAAPTLVGTTVTETMTGTCNAVAKTTPVQVAITKFKNGTASTIFKSAVTVKSSTATPTATSPVVPFANNTTAVTVTVPDSLTFTNSNTSITLLPIPGGATATTTPVTLTVKTNAKTGYTLAGCVLSANAIKGVTTSTIIGQLATVTAAATLPATATNFGAKATVTTTGSGTAALGTTWSTDSGKYLGYNSTCGTTGHSVIMKSTTPVNTNKLTLTNAVRAKALQPADVYTGTISYQVTPNYT